MPSIPIRTKKQTIKGEKLGKDFKCAGHPPFGFAYLDGKLIVDPKEQLIISKILKLRQSGMSLRAIAEELNGQKIPTRTGKDWYLSFVKTIIDRNQKPDRSITHEQSNQNRSYLSLRSCCFWQSFLDSFPSSQGPDSSHHRISGIEVA